MKSRENVGVVIFVGLAIRTCLRFFGIHDYLQRRVEVVSPLTSWYRVKECMALSRLNISPYAGDVCHQPPLLLAIFETLPTVHVENVFMVMDALAAVILYQFSKQFMRLQMKNECEEMKSFAKGTDSLFIKSADRIPETVALIYFLCPYTIVTCLAQSTIVLNNLVVAFLLWSMVSGWLVVASLCVAVLAYLSLYALVLIIPVILCVIKIPDVANMTAKLVLCISTFSLSLFLLLHTSANLYGSWDFFQSVYGFILEAPELTPNMGLFWYFFLEMFHHFRLFFLTVYQINTFIYTIPLVIVFRKYPFLVSYAFLSLMGLFKSYSNFGDLSTPLAMLPLWSYAYMYTRNVLLIAGMFFFTTILAPLMWQLWIYTGAGNANFFYAVTLAYCTAQVFLLSDVLYAFLRRRYHLVVGMNPKTPDGEEDGIVIMK